MVVFMWLLNLFSLFSCFGALVVTGFVIARSGNRNFWRIFLIVLFYTATYGAGMFYLISHYGFTIPEIKNLGTIPENPPFTYYLLSIANIGVFWLIISTTSQFLRFPSRNSYLAFLPLLLTGFLIPDMLLLGGGGFVHAHEKFFMIVRLVLGYSLMEHVVIACIVRRKLWLDILGKWFLLMMYFFALILIPLMFIEDFHSLYRGMLAYNFFEAAGFFFLTTTVMIGGIFYLSSYSDKKQKKMTFLDISREYGLTEREMDVLKELVSSSNVSYKDIAASLNISPETVKTHVSRIYRKLGVSAKQELKYKIGPISG